MRHASYSELGVSLGGRSDHALSEAGRAEAARVAAALAGRPLAAVVSSPVRRARETADAIATPHGLAVQDEPGVEEIDFGSWRGAAFEALDRLPGWVAWNRLRSLAQAPGGETMLAVQVRAVAAVQALAARYQEGELVVVSHGDVIRAVLAHALGMPIDLSQRLSVDPAGRSVLRLGDGVEVLLVNAPA